MVFKSLKIERPLFGNNKDKLVAELSLSGSNTTTTLILPNEVGDQILQLAKSAIVDAVEKTANDFIFEITTSIPETLKLENNGTY